MANSGENTPAGKDLAIQVIPDLDFKNGVVRIHLSRPVDKLILDPQQAAGLAMVIMRNAAIVAKNKRIILPPADFNVN